MFIRKCTSKLATVAINMYPVSGPYGGSSVFIWQMVSMLKRRGYRVRYDLKKETDLIILIDPRTDLEHKAFGMTDIRAYKQRHPGAKVLHRINECDARKCTSFMDELLRDANDVADATVFISPWLKHYFVERWFDPKKPNRVIYNGADPTIFHPLASARYSASSPMRVVTHHWSNNPMKGFPVYEQMDRMIAAGELDGFELWVVGRWPEHIQWQRAKTFPPCSGKALAAILRQCHLYLTASLWEPCGMHHVEGAQCGLPLVYHEDGGGICDAGGKYGLGFRNNLKAILLKAREEYPTLRQQVLAHMPGGDQMALDYMQFIQYILATR